MQYLPLYIILQKTASEKSMSLYIQPYQNFIYLTRFKMELTDPGSTW